VSSPAVPPPPAVASFLAGDERLERCPPNESYAEQVLERIVAEEVEDMLHAAAQGRWRKANTDGYDGARKAIEAWLLGLDGGSGRRRAPTPRW
jgi:hypothetical protein